VGGIGGGLGPRVVLEHVLGPRPGFVRVAPAPFPLGQRQFAAGDPLAQPDQARGEIVAILRQRPLTQVCGQLPEQRPAFADACLRVRHLGPVPRAETRQRLQVGRVVRIRVFRVGGEKIAGGTAGPGEVPGLQAKLAHGHELAGGSQLAGLPQLEGPPAIGGLDRLDQRVRLGRFGRHRRAAREPEQRQQKQRAVRQSRHRHVSG
jgi:hypothetical protein